MKLVCGCHLDLFDSEYELDSHYNTMYPHRFSTSAENEPSKDQLVTAINELTEAVRSINVKGFQTNAKPVASKPKEEPEWEVHDIFKDAEHEQWVGISIDIPTVVTKSQAEALKTLIELNLQAVFGDDEEWESGSLLAQFKRVRTLLAKDNK